MKNILWFSLGFLAYPLLFIPLMVLYAPESMMMWCMEILSKYFKLWGL